MNLMDLVTLEKAFKDIMFYEKDHVYKIANDIKACSVTQLLKKYTKEFEAKKVASIVAAKQGVLIEDVLELWDFKREYACEKGTAFHLFAENYLSRRWVPLDRVAITNFMRKQNPGLGSVEGFYEDVGRYVKNYLEFFKKFSEEHILVKPEMVVGDLSSQICGTVDILAYNFIQGHLAVFDYKTNRDIWDKAYGKMLKPLDHLKDDHINKYSLQLHLYAAIIEDNTPFKVPDLNIVWVAGDSFESIPTKDLRKEARQLLEIRRTELAPKISPIDIFK